MERSPFTATQLDAYVLRGSLLLRKLQGASAPPTNIRRATCTSIETSPSSPRQKGRCCAQQMGSPPSFHACWERANQDTTRGRLRPRTLTPRYEELSHHLRTQPLWTQRRFLGAQVCSPIPFRASHLIMTFSSYRWGPPRVSKNVPSKSSALAASIQALPGFVTCREQTQSHVPSDRDLPVIRETPR